MCASLVGPRTGPDRPAGWPGAAAWSASRSHAAMTRDAWTKTPRARPGLIGSPHFAAAESRPHRLPFNAPGHRAFPRSRLPRDAIRGGAGWTAARKRPEPEIRARGGPAQWTRPALPRRPKAFPHQLLRAQSAVSVSRGRHRRPTAPPPGTPAISPGDRVPLPLPGPLTDTGDLPHDPKEADGSQYCCLGSESELGRGLRSSIGSRLLTRSSGSAARLPMRYRSVETGSGPCSPRG